MQGLLDWKFSKNKQPFSSPFSQPLDTCNTEANNQKNQELKFVQGGSDTNVRVWSSKTQRKYANVTKKNFWNRTHPTNQLVQTIATKEMSTWKHTLEDFPQTKMNGRLKVEPLYRGDTQSSDLENTLSFGKLPTSL